MTRSLTSNTVDTPMIGVHECHGVRHFVTTIGISVSDRAALITTGIMPDISYLH